MSAITVGYVCQECGAEFDVSAEPIIPAQTYGPPENCYPSEGGEIEPEGCPVCGYDIDPAVIAELVSDRAHEYD